MTNERPRHPLVAARVQTLRAAGRDLEAEFLEYLYWRGDLPEEYLTLPDDDLARLAEEERKYLDRWYKHQKTWTPAGSHPQDSRATRRHPGDLRDRG